MGDCSGRESLVCTFTWKVENILWNALEPVEDALKSPTFLVPMSGFDTEWIIWMSPSRERSPIFISVGRIDEDMRDISVRCEVSCVTAEGNTKLTLYKDQKTFSGLNYDYIEFHSEDWLSMLKKRSLYFPGDCFTILCRLWTISSLEQPSMSMEYVAVTHIKATNISCRKIIPIAKALSSDYEIKCSPLPRDELEIILFRKNNSEYMSVSTGCKISEMQQNILLNLRLSVTDSSGLPLHVMEDCILFLFCSLIDFEYSSDDIKISRNGICSLSNFNIFNELKKKMYSPTDDLNFNFELVLGTESVETHIIDMNKVVSHDAVQMNEGPKTVLDALTRELESMYLEKKYADVQLKSGSEMFFAHKAVLCARSPVFAAMFDHDMVERKSGVIEVEDMDASTLDKFLLFTYTGQLKDFEEDITVKLLAAADKYQIISLREQCAISLRKLISVQNACRILKLADMHHEESLKNAAQEFICYNHRLILSSNEWKQFISLDGELTSEIILKLSLKYANV